MIMIKEFNLFPIDIKSKKIFQIKDNKLSFVNLILDSLDVIRMQPTGINSEYSGCNKLILFQDDRDKSRLIFCGDEENKIFSIYFPFKIEHDELGCLEIYFGSDKIETETVSFLRTILNAFEKQVILHEDFFLDEINQEYLQYKANEDDGYAYYNKILDIFKKLLSLDTGYIRYDYDEANSSSLHPVNHLDIFYSDDSSMKIGLREKYDLQKFLLLFDNSSQIKYMEQ